MNVAEIVDPGADVGRVRQLLTAAGVVVVPVTEKDAEMAGAMRSLAEGRELSVGDRCCLALTVRTEPAVVLPADRAWDELDPPVSVRLIR